jgi:serine/threonine protein kinase
VELWLTATTGATPVNVVIKFRRDGDRDVIQQEAHCLRLVNLACGELIPKPLLCVEYEGRAGLAMEYCQGQTLLQLVERTPHGKLHENDARNHLKCVIQCLNWCHEAKVVHRNLKLEKVIVNEERVRIVGFTHAKDVFSTDPRTLKGTINYLPPELMRDTNNAEVYDAEKVDVWCCGVMLYRVVCGKFPFEGEDWMEMRGRLQRGNYWPFPDDVSPDCQDLMTQMLNVNPEHRPCAADLVGNHPWLNEPLAERDILLQAFEGFNPGG